MPHSPLYQWKRSCCAAIGQSDPDQLLCLLESAIVALERRFAEWNEVPGTETELHALRESTTKLTERLAWWYACAYSAQA